MRNSSEAKQTIFRFDETEVDLYRQEVRHKGIAVFAQRKVFDLLVYLLENPNRTIDKQELQQAVWMGANLSDAALKVCIGKVRRLIGDDSRQQTIIKTIHGYGYRFIAKLEVPPQDEQAPTISPLTENYKEALSAAGRLSIAVLPFRDFGENPEQVYFSEGITEDIITELSRYSSLLVTASCTAMALKDSPDDALFVWWQTS